MSDVQHLPPHAPGLRIGLYGGSFNPPHDGHLLLAQTALKRLNLDSVWWLVSPGNPLKQHDGLPTLEARCEAVRALIINHGLTLAKFPVCDFEASLGSPYSYHTIAWLSSRLPNVHFVWLMGADNLASFQHWQHWQQIAKIIPICVIDRPSVGLKACASMAAHWLKSYRWPEHDAGVFALAQAPALLFLHGPRKNISSTQIRAAKTG